LTEKVPLERKLVANRRDLAGEKIVGGSYELGPGKDGRENKKP
jgi:hypothetical protein